MKIASYAPHGEVPRLGVVREADCVDLASLGVTCTTFADLWSAWDANAQVIEDAVAGVQAGTPHGQLEWLPPIDNGATLWAAATNYAEHLKEGNFARPDYPPFFLRNKASVVGHGGTVSKPWFSQRLDYEGELAIMIGRTARLVSEEDAMDYVAGYSCFNDGSVRDWQRHTGQITIGKNFFESGALGPWIATADAVADIHASILRTVVNGREVQQSAIGEAIWGIRYVISYLSAVTELRPGDVIALGTPGGVGARQSPPLFLFGGDSVEISVDGVGTLAHGVAEISELPGPWPAGVR